LIDQPEKQEDFRSLDPQEIKEGLPVWVQLHKRGARVAATIRGHSEDRSRCTVDLEIDDPIHPGQVIRQAYPIAVLRISWDSSSKGLTAGLMRNHRFFLGGSLTLQ
jgi:hypothetical protein